MKDPKEYIKSLYKELVDLETQYANTKNAISLTMLRFVDFMDWTVEEANDAVGVNDFFKPYEKEQVI